MIDLDFERLIDLSRLRNTVLLKSRFIPACRYSLSPGVQNENQCITELEKLIFELKTLSNIKLALCLTVDSTTSSFSSPSPAPSSTSSSLPPLSTVASPPVSTGVCHGEGSGDDNSQSDQDHNIPNLTGLLDLIFAHKGLINFIFLERRRSPSFVLSQLLDREKGKKNEGREKGTEGGREGKKKSSDGRAFINTASHTHTQRIHQTHTRMRSLSPQSQLHTHSHSLSHSQSRLPASLSLHSHDSVDPCGLLTELCRASRGKLRKSGV